MWSTGKGAIFVGGNDVVRALWGGECGAGGALEENSIKIGKKIEYDERWPGAPRSAAFVPV